MKPNGASENFQHPADGLYMLQPLGKFNTPDADAVQVIDSESVQAMAASFNAEADKPGFSGMLVDHEHFKHDPAKETVAYGWLMRCDARPDGLYGQIRWTGTGKKAVDGGDYRFFSTEFDPKDTVRLNPGKTPPQLRPMRLDGISLTNAPATPGGKPITNRIILNRTAPVKPMNTTASHTPASASAELSRMAREHATKTGRAFADAYSIVRSANPDLAAIATQRNTAPPDTITNRWHSRLRSGSGSSGGEVAGDWNSAVSQQIALNKTIRNGGKPATIQNRENRELTHAERCERETLVSTIRNRLGLGHSEAWAAARRQRPDLFIS